MSIFGRPVRRPRVAVVILALCAFTIVGHASAALAKKIIYPGSFAQTGMMTTPRLAHTATLLTDGTVLVAGGVDNNGVAQSNAEIYNPAAGTFARARAR